jgi:crotonobetainyl-CoA:carnitine CoA-transferase CaiB-like acyl-CoA transferase
MSMADIFKDPHYRERESIIEVPSEVGPLPQPAVIPRLSATPGRVTHAGPPLGAHTDEVLSSLLGLSPLQIAGLRDEGVV